MDSIVTQTNGKVSRVGAVILAGGLARRMGGVDKGLVQLAGKPMAQWVVERVTPQVSQLIINANRNEQTYAEIASPVVGDTMQGNLGPLAGLYTALEHFADGVDSVFMCPCDSPFVPFDMVERMHDARSSKDATVAVASDGQRLQPVFLLVKSSVMASLADFLKSGERKIDRWFDRETVAEVDFSDHADAFLNINTEEERTRIEQDLNQVPERGRRH